MIGALKISTDEAFTIPLPIYLAQDNTKAEGLLSIAGVITLMLLLGKLGGWGGFADPRRSGSIRGTW